MPKADGGCVTVFRRCAPAPRRATGVACLAMVALPPPSRHHGQHAQRGARGEGHQHDDDHRRTPLRAEEATTTAGWPLFSAKVNNVKKMKNPQGPDQHAHRARF